MSLLNIVSICIESYSLCFDLGIVCCCLGYNICFECCNMCFECCCILFNIFKNSLRPLSERVNIKNIEGMPPLEYAIRLQDIRKSELVIKYGANVNYITQDGESLFFLAASLHCIDICELLYKYQADINATDSLGNTALIKAILDKNKDMALYLLNKTDVINVNIKNKVGMSALLYAFLYIQDVEIIDILVKQNADIRVLDTILISIDNMEETLLDYLCRTKKIELVKLLITLSGDEIVKKINMQSYTTLIEWGIHTNEYSNNNYEPLIDL